MMTSINKKLALDIIDRLGIMKTYFFIYGKGPWRITAIDGAQENCEITLYKYNEFFTASQTLQNAVEKFNVSQSVFVELMKCLDDAEPNWERDKIAVMLVPIDFFRINAISYSTADINIKG